MAYLLPHAPVRERLRGEREARPRSRRRATPDPSPLSGSQRSLCDESFSNHRAAVHVRTTSVQLRSLQSIQSSMINPVILMCYPHNLVLAGKSSTSNFLMWHAVWPLVGRHWAVDEAVDLIMINSVVHKIVEAGILCSSFQE